MRMSILLLALLGPLAALAQDPAEHSEMYFPQRLKASELAAACASSKLTAKGRERRQYCAGFISGVEEAQRLVQSETRAESAQNVCVPENITASRLGDAYVRYVSNPDWDLGGPAALIVMEALQAAFPCR